MKSGIRNSFFNFARYKKDMVLDYFNEMSWFQENLLKYLLQKYFWSFVLLLVILFLSISSYFIPLLFKESVASVSLDQLVPKGFVLMPLEISNSKDISAFIGHYGVLDLYAYSQQTGLPDKQVASHVKVLPPQTEEGQFTALIPEKSAIDLFEYSGAFYAVIQNPDKKDTKVYKKFKKKSLVVIEESF